MCTYGTLLHPTCGTRQSYVYLWDLQLLIRDACNSSQKSLLGPFFIRRVPVRPFCIRLMGPDDLCVTSTCGTFLHLHPTCGTRQRVCHLYHVCRRVLISQKRFDNWSRTRVLDLGMERLYHCARCLVVLISLWR
jgi:hypothetical protein